MAWKFNNNNETSSFQDIFCVKISVVIQASQTTNKCVPVNLNPYAAHRQIKQKNAETIIIYLDCSDSDIFSHLLKIPSFNHKEEGTAVASPIITAQPLL